MVAMVAYVSRPTRSVENPGVADALSVEVRQLFPSQWRLIYACGHQLPFTPPRTPGERLQLKEWLQRWSTCFQCPQLTA
jgi:hypothetical protein